MTATLTSTQLSALAALINAAQIPPVHFNSRPVRSLTELSGGRIEISTVNPGSAKSDFWCSSTEYVIPQDHPIFREWYEGLFPTARPAFPLARTRDRDLERYHTALLGHPVQAPSRASDSPQLAPVLEGLRALLRDEKFRKKAFDLVREAVSAAERQAEDAFKEQKTGPRKMDDVLDELESVIASRNGHTDRVSAVQ
jgi:hypothetical protein